MKPYVYKVALGLFVAGMAAVTVGSVVAAQSAPTFVSGMAGQVYSRHYQSYNHQYSFVQRIEVFVDSNGCEYLVTTMTRYDVGSMTMTPRINSATKQPHCRARR